MIISENRLRKIIDESIRRVLTEGMSAQFVLPEAWRGVKGMDKKFAIFISKKYGIPLNKLVPVKDFNKNIFGFNIKPKATKVKKSPNMSDEDYLNLVLNKNKKFKAEWLNGDNWKPLDISHLVNDISKAEMYTNRYYISSDGRLAVVNDDDASKSHISIPYFDRSTKSLQINLRIYVNGQEFDHRCPHVRSLVEKVFGPKAAQLIKYKEIELMNQNF